MKTYKKYFILFILAFSFQYNCHAQNKQKSLDIIIKKHIEEFKNDFNISDEMLYVVFKYNYSDYKDDRVKFLEPTLDSLFVNKKSYLIQFTLKNNKLLAVNFKVIKVNNKELKLINLMNGKEYKL